jgi:hypothetical protein
MQATQSRAVIEKINGLWRNKLDIGGVVEYTQYLSDKDYSIMLKAIEELKMATDFLPSIKQINDIYKRFVKNKGYDKKEKCWLCGGQGHVILQRNKAWMVIGANVFFENEWAVIMDKVVINSAYKLYGQGIATVCTECEDGYKYDSNSMKEIKCKNMYTPYVKEFIDIMEFKKYCMEKKQNRKNNENYKRKCKNLSVDFKSI